MPKLLIIDGSSMLSTSYYGNLPKSILFAKTEEEKEKYYEQILHTSDGKYTNAMFTMLRTLLGIYKKVKPEYVALCLIRPGIRSEGPSLERTSIRQTEKRPRNH